MKALFRIAAAALLLAACQDVSGPNGTPATSSPAPRAQEDPLVAEVMAAARNAPPSGAGSELVVAVLDRGATPVSRLVSYQYGNEYSLYRFVKRDGRWNRLGPIEERKTTGINGSPIDETASKSGMGAAIYPHRIAKIGYDVANWYTTANAAGSYSRSGYWNWYDGTYGTCYPGTYTSGGQQVSLVCVDWYASRSNPSVSWTAFGGTSSGSSPYTCNSSSNCRYWGAQSLSLSYRLDVQTVFTVSGSGPTIITTPGEYTWQAYPANGSGSYTYQWSVFWHNTGVTQTLGTGQSETMWVEPGSGEFELSVTVTSGAQSAAWSTFVSTPYIGGCPNPTEIICS